jgi:hypothetical protein
VIEHIVIALIIAIVIGALLVYLLGPVIASIPAPVAAIVGNFFVKFGWAIGLLVALWWFFIGGRYL